ncbi:sodium/pantothenate symporter, partial [Desulfovibrio sp. OttesenSCG-928-C14]|nr:sodium/pantothenate symporter [Desulfovibrio sp. OttesenSCG-928-C14]
LVAGVLIFVAVVHAGGGIESCMLKLRDIDPGLLTPEGPGGKIPQPFILSFWILVGLGTLGLPHTAQKCIGYKDTKSLHNAMIIGTFAIGFMILLMHLTGALGRAVIQDLPAGDLAMPTMTIQLLHPVLVGIFVAGPLAAIMSTVDSMLLLSCATLVNDIYVHHVLKGKPESVPPQRIRGLSFITTAVLGVLVFVAAIEPPDLLVWINLFAFGGMEAAFLWPLVLGLYWKKANAAGALASVIAGVGCYFAIVLFKIPIWGMHAIVPTALVGFVAFALGTRFGQKPDPDTVRIFAEDV